MGKLKNNSDKELIIFLKDGSQQAYTEIFSRYYRLMFVFAYKKLRDEDLAKDFVQELFFRLWEKREMLYPEGNLAQYLYISLRSRMFGYFEHQKVASKYIDFLAGFAEANSEQADHLVREKQLSDYIDRQIEGLPKKMREVFELSRKEHLSHGEIAKKLGTTQSNVSHHINNALKILGTKLG
ncbi:MAG: sigma-70 family RNA polymerase sigma factor [Proteobacteria bacterium]|nr:MAG: sigma-70 family RNA polymerase sigma factor [Pseudomonadota bacterium]